MNPTKDAIARYCNLLAHQAMLTAKSGASGLTKSDIREVLSAMNKEELVNLTLFLFTSPDEAIDSINEEVNFYWRKHGGK